MRSLLPQWIVGTKHHSGTPAQGHREELEMAGRQRPLSVVSGEALGRKLLQSVREMKAGQRAREATVEPNEVARARPSRGRSQARFAEALHISKRTLQECKQGRRRSA
jgi:putative transcriptional regulator